MIALTDIRDMGAQRVVAEWVASRIPHAFHEAGFPWDGRMASAQGVVRDNKILAGIVYHDHNPWYRRIEASFACESGSRWATREIIGLLLLYPFADCHCQVVVTQTPSRHALALKMNRQLGFEHCGIIPHGMGDDDLTICALTHDRARRWIGRFEYGWKEQRAECA